MAYDPFDDNVQLDPYPSYEALRRHGPVYRNEEKGFWALHRFDDVWSAVHDPGTYSSARGVFISRGSDPDEDKASSFAPMLIMMDAPRHTKLRAVVNRAFTARRIAAMHRAIEELTRSLIEPVRDAGSFDLVETVAGPLPTFVIADLLGVPRGDYDQFRQWSDQMVGANARGDEDLKATQMKAAAALSEYFLDIAGERRKRPRTDLVSGLLEAEVDGQRLSEEELLGFCLLLLVAGNETTVNLISNMFLAIATQPVQQSILREAKAADAVEEFLRYDSPVQALARTLTRDVELHGATMEAGEKVMLLFGAANRDTEEFGADAARLDVRRQIRRHLAFGHGPHYCLGASLARLEGQIACEQLLRAFPAIQLAAEPNRLISGPMRGLQTLELTVRPS
jgi:cytochrome P450